MSGGSFDYKCFQISAFADELKHKIDVNDDDTEDDWGGTLGDQYSTGTIAALTNIQKMIELSGKLAREVEWLYSGDHGEESFQRLVSDIFKERDRV